MVLEYNLILKKNFFFKATWKEISLSSIRPLARYSTVYAHNRYGLYISGGKGFFNDVYNDIWMFEFSSNLWRKLDQLGSKVPENRYGASGGIYPNYEELNTRIINNFYMSHGKSKDEMFDNVYRYGFTDARNLNGIWRENFKNRLGPFSAESPHSRYGHSSTMLSSENLLLFGGCLSGKYTGGPCPSSDSWLYESSPNKWVKIDANCLAPKLYSSMASLVSDGLRYSAVLFGGKVNDRSIFTTKEDNENEVIIFDDIYKKWTKKRVQGFYFPETRYSHVMCTGKFNNEYGVFLFGGYGHKTETNLADLWFLRANVTSALNSVTINDCTHYFTSIHLHAILMFTGWAIFINIGTFIARYMKYSTKWIKYHRCLQSIGLFLVSAGIFFGFWSAHGVPHLAHSLIGSAAFLFSLLQPFSAMMKKSQRFDYYIDEDEKEKRTKSLRSKMRANLWGILHRYFGRFAILLAVVNMSLGVFYGVLDPFWWIIWFSFLGSVVILYLIMEIKQSCFKTKKQSKSHTTEDDLNRTLSTNNLKSNQTTFEDLTIISSGDERIRLEPLNDLPKRYIERPNPKTPPPPYSGRRSHQSIRKTPNIGQSSVTTLETSLSTSPYSSPSRKNQFNSSSMPKKSNLKKTNYTNPNFEQSPTKISSQQQRYQQRY